MSAGRVAATFAIATLLSGGIGAGAALLVPMPGAVSKPAAAVEAPAPQPADDLHVIDLPTIVTNLSGSGDVWIRLDATLVSRDALTREEEAAVQADFTLFLRSLRLDSVVGPSDVALLIDELQARARSRTQDRVSDVLVRTILFE